MQYRDISGGSAGCRGTSCNGAALGPPITAPGLPQGTTGAPSTGRAGSMQLVLAVMCSGILCYPGHPHTLGLQEGDICAF